MRLLLTGLLVVHLGAASVLPELPPDLRRLAGLAASLPPEFQADALLQMVESRGSLEPELRKSLIQQAAILARQAKNPYPMVAVAGTSADSRQAFAASALTLRLDRLSLEARAIRLMLALDATSARVMFQQEMQKPAPPNGTCASALIPQLDDYFDLAAQVFARGFTPKEIARKGHVAMLLQIIAGVSEPYEVAPAARMILSVHPPHFEVALNAFTARLESVTSEDRSFTETGMAVQREIGNLAAAGISRAPLARAYRKYLTSNYSNSHCSDSSGARLAGNPTTSPVDWFNQSGLRGDLPAIELTEITAKDADRKLQVDLFWTAPDSEKILAAARGLRTSPGGLMYSPKERATSEWNQKLRDFVDQIRGWDRSGEESDLDFFNEKALVYESLIDLCPPGEGRQRLMAAFADFLNHANAAVQTPVDWFWHAQNMYRRLNQSGDTDAAKLMTVYKNSGNLMLEIYAQLNGY